MGSALHRAEEQDVSAITQAGVAARELAVDTRRDLGLGRDPDERQQILDRGALGHCVALWTVRAARQVPAQVGEQRDGDGQLSRVADGSTPIEAPSDAS